MNEENLRQAILAIAVNIDYKKEEYEKNISDDVAYAEIGDPAFLILSGDTIREFKEAWRLGIPESKLREATGLKLQGPNASSTALAIVGDDTGGIPPLGKLFSDNIIKGLIMYVSLELSWSIFHLPYSSTMEMLMSRYHDIVRRFIQCPRGDMFVELASRECVYDAIKAQLKRDNNERSMRMYNILNNSNRPQAVFDMFKQNFAERSSTAYYWSGSFLRFLMNTYIYYFYNTILRKDIWSELKSQDTAKAEQELDVHNLNYQEQAVAPTDLYIHDWLIAIAEANWKLFRHTGQGEKVNGLMYDLVYLLIGYLMSTSLEEVNGQLDDFRVEFTDPYDWHSGLRNNRNVEAKINNAKQLLPTMFEYIRSGNFNTTKIMDFRREAYKLGRSNTQGTNPVWRSENKSSEGEASLYFDTEFGRYNYKAFETILRGVTAAYSLLRALKTRGYNIIETYLETRGYPDARGKPLMFSALFTLPSVYRHMDYLSSLKYLPLMMQLQQKNSEMYQRGKEPQEGDIGSGELLDFDGMVHEYAGSIVHTEKHIISNRRFAYNRGLLYKPRLKNRDALTSDYEKKRSVTSFLTAFPYTFLEMEDARYKADLSRQFSSKALSAYASLFVHRDVFKWRGPQEDPNLHKIGKSARIELLASAYDGFNHNIFMQNADWYTKEHMQGTGPMESVSWSIGTHRYSGVLQTDKYIQDSVIDPATNRPVPRGIVLLTNFMHIATEDMMCATYFNEDDQMALSYVTRGQEREWLTDTSHSGGIDHYRLYGSLPMQYDPHTLALAAGVVTTQDFNTPTLAEISSDELYQKAQDRLRCSIGFPLYIGLENLYSSSTRKVLNDIRVWDDYKGQTQLYYERMVELCWMQEAYVNLLEMMFEVCWSYTHPGIRTQTDPDTFKHAKGLFNSLLSRVFKREDVLWFFNYLAGKYVVNGRAKKPQEWPSKIVNFQATADPSKNRQPIPPKWALMLGGPFEGWVEMFNLKPDTEFDDGPYQRFKESIIGIEDVADQFVLLHAFLYQKTLYLKVLRDAYCVTFNSFGEDNCTLGCELNSQLQVTKTFNPNQPLWCKDVASIRRCATSIEDYVISQVTSDNIEFEMLVSALGEHYNECATSLQKMVNYDVSVTEEQASMFDKWGDAFANIPPIINSDVLNRIRGRYTVDSNGFVCGCGEYFKVRYGQDTLYLHNSGAFLCMKPNGECTEFALPHSTAKELSKYNELLQGGIKDASITVLWERSST